MNKTMSIGLWVVATIVVVGVAFGVLGDKMGAVLSDVRNQSVTQMSVPINP